MADRLSRHHEPRVLRACSGLVAVSGAYLEDLHRRYPDTADLPSLELPFPGAPEDFERLEAITTGALPFDPGDGLIHWVSIGRGGADLSTALEGLFLALNRHAPPALLQRLRLHFLGTSYAAAGRGVPSIRPLAQRHGLAHLVEERTDRLPLSLTLATLKAASALLVIGSDDPAYTASKIVPYLLARRPLLAVMHERSPAISLIGRCGGAALVTFDTGERPEALADAIDRAWLQQDQHAQLRPLDPLAIAPHTAAAQAAQLTAFLQGCR